MPKGANYCVVYPSHLNIKHEMLPVKRSIGTLEANIKVSWIFFIHDTLNISYPFLLSKIVTCLASFPLLREDNKRLMVDKDDKSCHLEPISLRFPLKDNLLCGASY